MSRMENYIHIVAVHFKDKKNDNFTCWQMLLKIVEEWLAMRCVWRPIYIIDGIINKKWVYNKYKCTFFNIETKVITIWTIYCTAKMLGFKLGWWYMYVNLSVRIWIVSGKSQEILSLEVCGNPGPRPLTIGMVSTKDFHGQIFK